MNTVPNIEQSTVVQYSKLNDYGMLIKTRLSLTVVMTSLLGYLIVSEGAVNFTQIAVLAIGGFLITASANAINEVIEKDFDALMKRTAIRPLASGRMKISEAVLFAGISCLVGVSMLAMIHPLTALLGMISFVLYAFVYTPLKRYSTIAVAVGAIPGALPVLIGCTAYDGQVTIMSFGLFVIQFLWQFPHFWSIGFLGFEDYKNAGYKLLPESDNKLDINLGKYTLLYISLILPVIFILYYFGEFSFIASVGNILMTLVFGYFGIRFYRQFDRKTALMLMFCSFFYMPAILLISLFF